MAVSFNFTGEYAIDQGADWYATFIYKQPAEITNISGNGTTVTVTVVPLPEMFVISAGCL